MSLNVADNGSALRRCSASESPAKTLRIKNAIERSLSSLALALALLTAAPAVSASVRHQGSWPEQEPNVSLRVDGVPRAEALRKLADAAGWSVVTRGLPDSPVSLDVRDQPPSRVLDQLLAGADFTVERDGSLLSIAPVSAEPAAPSASAAEPAVAPPSSAEKPSVPAANEPEDRTVTGGDLRVEAGETVGDVTVTGGSLELLGTADGDVTVVGGSAHIYKGAHVTGDATAVGGSLVVDDGAKVDGEVSVTGGPELPNIHIRATDDKDAKGHVALGMLSGAPKSTMAELLDDAGHAVERSIMLFVLGIILIALGSARMQTLESEVAARPMRSLALGVVGAIASLALFVALCVTIIGIPVAVAGVVAGLLIAGAGICAVLATAGGALVGHRTSNPYVHLAVGIVLFLLLSAIPYVGGLVTAAVTFMGIGVMVATRIAGLVPPRNKNGFGQGPYRTAAVG